MVIVTWRWNFSFHIISRKTKEHDFLPLHQALASLVSTDPYAKGQTKKEQLSTQLISSIDRWWNIWKWFGDRLLKAIHCSMISGKCQMSIVINSTYIYSFLSSSVLVNRTVYYINGSIYSVIWSLSCLHNTFSH